MFYILNFAIVLWIYGTLNKIKLNEIDSYFLSKMKEGKECIEKVKAKFPS